MTTATGTITIPLINLLPYIEKDMVLSSFVQNLDHLAMWAATMLGYIGVAIIVYGSIKALFHFIRSTLFKSYHMSKIRIDLGKHLALGLEFLVGKDIIESIVQPTWDDLGKLGAIILLRTMVSIFLARELKEVEEELRVEKQELELAILRRKSKKS